MEGIAGERADATPLVPRGLLDRGARLVGAATTDAEFDGGAVEPAEDVPLATRLAIGVTAGTYRFTFRPSGSPVDVSVGGPVVADLILHEFQPPPSGSGLPPTNIDRSAVARAGICSGPY